MEKVSTLVRLDNDLYNIVKELAKQQKRSINQQIVFILQQYVNMITK